MRIIFFILFLQLCYIPSFSQNVLSQKTTQKKLSEAEKIDKLIEAVGDLKDAQFIRNGSAYSASQAKDHLKMKLKKAGNDIKTAKDFIDKIASKSSLSGEDYKIKFKDGKEITTKVFFEEKLREL